MERLILPDAEWRHRDGLDRLVDVLGAGARASSAARCATPARIPVRRRRSRHAAMPERVIELLKAPASARCRPASRMAPSPRCWKAGRSKSRRCAATSSTDGRRATVAFTDDWREDAARRDFTMNALYADPLTGELFDYFGGITDLEARRVRFIGDPLKRIAEDHLRILRFFRFLARFGDQADPDGARCLYRAREGPDGAVARADRDELLKLLVARTPYAWSADDRARHLRAGPARNRATSAERLAHWPSAKATGIAPDPIRRLAAVLPPNRAMPTSRRAAQALEAERKRLVAAPPSPLAGAQGPRLSARQRARSTCSCSDRTSRQIERSRTWEARAFRSPAARWSQRGLPRARTSPARCAPSRIAMDRGRFPGAARRRLPTKSSLRPCVASSSE
jgi:poly(A) polymerase